MCNSWTWSDTFPDNITGQRKHACIIQHPFSISDSFFFSPLHNLYPIILPTPCMWIFPIIHLSLTWFINGIMPAMISSCVSTIRFLKFYTIAVHSVYCLFCDFPQWMWYTSEPYFVLLSCSDISVFFGLWYSMLLLYIACYRHETEYQGNVVWHSICYLEFYFLYIV